MIADFFSYMMIDPRAMFGAFMGVLSYIAMQPQLKIATAITQLIVGLTVGAVGADYIAAQVPFLKQFGAGALAGFLGNTIASVGLSLAASRLPEFLSNRVKTP